MIKMKKFLYQEIAETLKDRIRQGDLVPGERFDSENDLSTQFGANRMTLRKALAILEKEGWIEKVQGSGTYVSYNGNGKKASEQKTEVLYFGDTEFHFFSSLYQCILEESHNFDINLSTVHVPMDKEKRFNNASIRSSLRETDAIICNRHSFGLIKEFGNYQGPLIMTNHTDEENFQQLEKQGMNGYYLSCSSFNTHSLASRYLVKKGHQKIAYLGPPHLNQDKNGFAIDRSQRLSVQGFLAGLACGKHEAPVGFGAGGNPNDTKALNSLLDWLKSLPELPTAFVCEGDFRSAVLFRALHKLGKRCPEDVSIVGTGNTPWTEIFTPALTSVCLGEAQIAKLALVLANHPNTNGIEKITVDSKIIERDSVKDLRD